MIRNFIKKKGDQFTFAITYPSDVDFTSVEMGIKRSYNDEDYLIFSSIGHGITKIDERTYQINIPYTEMAKLDYGMYVYDVRTKSGQIPITPLSGKLIIQETVYYKKD